MVAKAKKVLVKKEMGSARSRGGVAQHEGYWGWDGRLLFKCGGGGGELDQHLEKSHRKD